MNKKMIFLFLCTFAFVALCGCDYEAVNSPRHVVSDTSGNLTKVTTYEESRSDTYSEYVSSLEAAAESERLASENIGNLRDTAITAPPDNFEKQTAVTTVPDGIQPPSETVVGSSDNISDTNQTSSTAITVPPSVPSEMVNSVAPDTAITTTKKSP